MDRRRISAGTAAPRVAARRLRAGIVAAALLAVTAAAGTSASVARSSSDEPAPRTTTGTYTYDTCPGVFPGSEQQCQTHKVVTEIKVQRMAATIAAGARNLSTNATADVERPFGIFVRVETKPQQKARVRWTIVCERNSGAAYVDADEGRYTTTSTKRHYLPIDVDSPDNCSARVTATSTRGQLKLRIYAEVPGRLISDTIVAPEAAA